MDTAPIVANWISHRRDCACQALLSPVPRAQRLRSCRRCCFVEKGYSISQSGERRTQRCKRLMRRVVRDDEFGGSIRGRSWNRRICVKPATFTALTHNGRTIGVNGWAINEHRARAESSQRLTMYDGKGRRRESNSPTSYCDREETSRNFRADDFYWRRSVCSGSHLC